MARNEVRIKISADTSGVTQAFGRVSREAQGLAGRLGGALKGFDPAQGIKGALGGFGKAGTQAGQSFAKNFVDQIGQGIGQGIGQVMANLPLQAASMGFNALAGAVGGSVDTFRRFDETMVQVGVVSQTTGTQALATLRDEVERLGANTSKSATEVATMTVSLSRAGFSAEESAAALEGIVRASEATGSSLEAVGDIGAKTIRTFAGMGYEASDMNKVMDLFVSTANNSNTQIEGLGESMAYLGPMAAAANQPLEDILIAVGLLGDKGIQGSMAGTNLASALENLKQASAASGSELAAMSRGSARAAQAIAAIGTNVRNADGTMRPLMELLPELQRGFAGLSQQDQDIVMKALFGIEGGRAMTALLETTPAAIDKLTNKVMNSAGVARQSGEEMQQGLGGALTQLSSAVEGLQIQFGEALAPVIEQVARLFTAMISSFNETGAFETLQAGMASLGESIAAIAGDSELMDALAIAIAEVVSAVGGLVGDGATNLAQWVSENKENIPGLIEQFRGFLGTMGEVAGSVIQVLAALTPVLAVITKLAAGMISFAAATSKVPLGILNAGFQVLGGVVSAVSRGFQAFMNALGAIVGKIPGLSGLLGLNAQAFDTAKGSAAGMSASMKAAAGDVSSLTGETGRATDKSAKLAAAMGATQGAAQQAGGGFSALSKSILGATGPLGQLLGMAGDLLGVFKNLANIKLPPLPGGGGEAPQPKAKGGPVAGGGLYLVGERGPELFVPPTHGKILTAKETQALQRQGVPGFARGGRVRRDELVMVGEQGAESFAPDLARDAQGRFLPEGDIGEDSIRSVIQPEVIGGDSSPNVGSVAGAVPVAVESLDTPDGEGFGDSELLQQGVDFLAIIAAASRSDAIAAGIDAGNRKIEAEQALQAAQEANDAQAIAAAEANLEAASKLVDGFDQMLGAEGAGVSAAERAGTASLFGLQDLAAQAAGLPAAGAIAVPAVELPKSAEQPAQSELRVQVDRIMQVLSPLADSIKRTAAKPTSLTVQSEKPTQDAANILEGIMRSATA